ncbi:MAG: class I SAM-dependent methyltransferase [Oligoflexia bacterium]|nr:class I SAM-dependent methyltransferase [Oligoflexia bacterium]
MNLAYRSENLSSFFSRHRTVWNEFYPSERHVLERLAPSAQSKVLDMGCACGGLGAALKERFSISSYCGVDINPQCIESAAQLCPWGQFSCGDFLQVHRALDRDYDLACSLSCADWNIQTEKLLAALAEHVRPSGHLVISCRLSNAVGAEGVLEARQSLSYAESGGVPTSEWAPYKVFAPTHMLDLLSALPGASNIYAYGYWGDVPSSVSGLGLKQVFYCVLSIQLGGASRQAGPAMQLEIDPSLFRPSAAVEDK